MRQRMCGHAAVEGPGSLGGERADPRARTPSWARRSRRWTGSRRHHRTDRRSQSGRKVKSFTLELCSRSEPKGSAGWNILNAKNKGRGVGPPIGLQLGPRVELRGPQLQWFYGSCSFATLKKFELRGKMRRGHQVAKDALAGIFSMQRAKDEALALPMVYNWGPIVKVRGLQLHRLCGSCSFVTLN